MIEQAKEKLTAEKELSDPKLSLASIMFPNNGDLSKAEYLINLQPENGGTTFSFYYKLNGELRNMTY